MTGKEEGLNINAQGFGMGCSMKQTICLLVYTHVHKADNQRNFLEYKIL